MDIQTKLLPGVNLSSPLPVYWKNFYTLHKNNGYDKIWLIIMEDVPDFELRKEKFIEEGFLISSLQEIKMLEKKLVEYTQREENC